MVDSWFKMVVAQRSQSSVDDVFLLRWAATVRFFRRVGTIRLFYALRWNHQIVMRCAGLQPSRTMNQLSMNHLLFPYFSQPVYHQLSLFPLRRNC